MSAYPRQPSAEFDCSCKEEGRGMAFIDNTDQSHWGGGSIFLGRDAGMYICLNTDIFHYKGNSTNVKTM